MITLDEARSFYAKIMAAISLSTDPRLERIFESIPREAFLGIGPWKMMAGRKYVSTPTPDPIYLYQNALFALNADKGINNGEPSLHARWLGASSPKAGDTIIHIGADTGYYTAILSLLALPDGKVHAYEIEESLASKATENLSPFENVTIVGGDAVTAELPPSDLIYVNAGVVSPPLNWLEALKPEGRMIFPWCPSPNGGMAVLVTRVQNGFSLKPLMPAWFIPCVGASDNKTCSLSPNLMDAWTAASLYLKQDRDPDDTSIAIYDNVWISSKPVR